MSTNTIVTNHCIIGNTMFSDGDKIEIRPCKNAPQSDIIPYGISDIVKIDCHKRTITLVKKMLLDQSYTEITVIIGLNELQSGVDRGEITVKKIDGKAEDALNTPKKPSGRATVHVPMFSRFHEAEKKNAEVTKSVDYHEAEKKFVELLDSLFGILPKSNRENHPEKKGCHCIDCKTRVKKDAPKAKKPIVGKTAVAADTKAELPEFTFDHPYILPKYFGGKIAKVLVNRWMRTRNNDDDWYPFVFAGQTFLVRHRKSDNAITVKGHTLGRVVTVRTIPIKDDVFDFEKGLVISMIKMLCQFSGLSFKMFNDSLAAYPYKSELRSFAEGNFNKSTAIDVHKDTSNLNPRWNIFRRAV